jgi:hypothetical protein
MNLLDQIIQRQPRIAHSGACSDSRGIPGAVLWWSNISAHGVPDATTGRELWASEELIASRFVLAQAHGLTADRALMDHKYLKGLGRVQSYSISMGEDVPSLQRMIMTGQPDSTVRIDISF